MSQWLPSRAHSYDSCSVQCQFCIQSINSLPDELTVIPLAFKTLIAVYCDNFTLDVQTDGKLVD
ncbi:hypothetical protein BpHYR1_052763 [Brachionus plicatilis]|uniref:Uncharacterized protein n=1 Tax=Brachionus plicatilis TaxID=10195 RepID=A0A3M7T0U8_BRAPC|nr:hypothetical protein BpHYR1_052763 [Brachionus plicatilis]